jgi:hypothetical protein
LPSRIPSLDESAWELAKNNTAGVYKSAAFSIATAGVSVLAGAGAAGLSSDRSAEEVVAISIVIGLAGIFVCLAAVLVFQVAVAPLRQRNELRQTWDGVGLLGSDGIAVRLTDFAREGDDLLSHCKAGGYTSQDKSAVDNWTKEVVAFLSEQCDADLAKKFTLASRGTAPLVGRLEKRINALDEIVGLL